MVVRIAAVVSGGYMLRLLLMITASRLVTAIIQGHGSRMMTLSSGLHSPQESAGA